MVNSRPKGFPVSTQLLATVFAGNRKYMPNFVVGNNITLEEAAAAGGFEYFNFMQVVVEHPGGALSGCLGDVPYTDPPEGGCIIPNIEADDLPFYYDVWGDLGGYRVLL